MCEEQDKNFEDELEENSWEEEEQIQGVSNSSNDSNNIKVYWNEITEQAVIDYLYLHEMFYDDRITEELKEAKKKRRKVNQAFIEEMKRLKTKTLQNPNREEQRNKIFSQHISNPLLKLIENILFNYRLFVPGIDIKTQIADCYTFVYEKFTRFNPWQRNKSFSYYGTVAKHYMLGNRKEQKKEVKIMHDFDSVKEEIEISYKEEMKINKKEDKIIKFFNYITETIEQGIEDGTLTKNDRKVGDAIVQIFKKHEILGVYNKGQIYQLIKEITGLETKDITYSLYRFRVNYKILKQEFIKGNE